MRLASVNTYKLSDVSAFSVIDRRSIVQYPQLKETTDLDYNVGDQQVLSDLDKAYIAVMYPRTAPHPKAPVWAFEYALGKASVQDESYKKELLECAKEDMRVREATIDPARIRTSFSKWCGEAHMPKSEY